MNAPALQVIAPPRTGLAAADASLKKAGERIAEIRRVSHSESAEAIAKIYAEAVGAASEAARVLREELHIMRPPVVRPVISRRQQERIAEREDRKQKCAAIRAAAKAAGWKAQYTPGQRHCGWQAWLNGITILHKRTGDWKHTNGDWHPAAAQLTEDEKSEIVQWAQRGDGRRRDYTAKLPSPSITEKLRAALAATETSGQPGAKQ